MTEILSMKIATPAVSDTGDPFLLTPGPLTTSKAVKAAMLHDWGSRDSTFIRMNAEVLECIAVLAGGSGTHVTVPLQGSGTFAVEAMLTNFVPRDGKVLILVNGSYGRRAVKICQYAGRASAVLETAEDTPPDVGRVEAALAADPGISHVFAVQCETTSGILNPVSEVGTATARAGRRFLVDAMSAFGALPLDARQTPFDAMAASSNKCLEGVPGIGYVVCRTEALVQTKGNATSLSLDLYDQWAAMKATRQWRFTPPLQVIAALHQAIEEHAAEGGIAGRRARYVANCRILVDGMRAMGFETLLPDRWQAPIIVTFRMPRDPRFDFQMFYDRLKDRGYVIYPGKLTVAESFRIGCIGRLSSDHMHGALQAIRSVLTEMGVRDCAPERGLGGT